MNNGITGAGRLEKESRLRIYGKPKNKAKILSGHGTTRTIWLYREILMWSYRITGWNGGSAWQTVEPLGLGRHTHKQVLMVKIDKYLDARDADWETFRKAQAA